MRPTFGVCWACLALTSLAACSSASPPPPEGNATLSFVGGSLGNHFIAGPQGAPDATKFGGTVLSGTNGVGVSCKVKGRSIQGHIESSDMSLDVNSDDAVNAKMTFYTAGIHGSQNAVSSVDLNTNSPAYTCTLTVSGGIYVVKTGSIFAAYDCPNVRDPANLTSAYHTSGYFLFTGCET